MSYQCYRCKNTFEGEPFRRALSGGFCEACENVRKENSRISQAANKEKRLKIMQKARDEHLKAEAAKLLATEERSRTEKLMEMMFQLLQKNGTAAAPVAEAPKAPAPAPLPPPPTVEEHDCNFCGSDIKPEDYEKTRGNICPKCTHLRYRIAKCLEYSDHVLQYAKRRWEKIQKEKEMVTAAPSPPAAKHDPPAHHNILPSDEPKAPANPSLAEMISILEERFGAGAIHR